MCVEIVPMEIADYEEVVRLWRSVEGVGLHDYEDSREGISFYLERNPGLSLVARQSGVLVGAVLCGHDGRRGSINHLAVALGFRLQAVGRMLVDRCLTELQLIGIRKCNIVVFRENESGRAFWKRLGWDEREYLVPMQKSINNEVERVSPHYS